MSFEQVLWLGLHMSFDRASSNICVDVTANLKSYKLYSEIQQLVWHDDSTRVHVTLKA